jgi:SAM-dependent methyltransferase
MTLTAFAPASLPYGEAFYTYQKTGSLSSADEVVPVVHDIVRPSSVADVGCGVGSWLAAFARAGVEDIVGLDGDHVPCADLMIPADRFHAIDLREPYELPRTFDLAVSLEVAEHLPASSADGFVDSLTKLAPAILFSAAVPHQGGWHHLNEQWPQYWAEIFARRRFFSVDCLRERFWNQSNVRWWYAQNMVLYLRDDHPLWRHYPRSSEPLRALVHPENYLLRVADLKDAMRRRGRKEMIVRIAERIGGAAGRAVRAVSGGREVAERR